MIIPVLSLDEKKIVNSLRYHWKSEDSCKAIAKGLKDSCELYVAGTEYLIRAMLLYQPTVVKSINSNHTKKIWVYAAEALYDSALLLSFNLFDTGKNIKFKNLVCLNRQIAVLTNDDLKSSWNLDPSIDIAETINRIKNQRDKRIAHHERDGVESLMTYDPLVSLEYARKYIEKFYSMFLDTEFMLDSLPDLTIKVADPTFDAVGIQDRQRRAKALNELKEYLSKAEKKYFSEVT
jgi:hypothetical protein